MKPEDGMFLGPREAAEMGLETDGAPEHSCEHCGKRLEPLGVVLNGRVAWVGRRECGCEGEVEAARIEEDKVRAREHAEREMAQERRLRSAGITKRYASAEVSSAQCANYLREFADCNGSGLYIHGGVGTGKTALASALARKFVEAGYKVILTTSIGMLESIQETYGSEASSRDACHGYGECDVLVIDDMGKESASSWSVMTLFQIVNMRYESMLPTIVTSQYTLYGLAKRLSRSGESETAEAIVSRLGGTCEEVRLPGGDRRRK